MKATRVILSLVGLVFLFLAYLTHSYLYLAIAIIAFFAGLLLMRSQQRTGPRKNGSDAGKQA